MVSTALSYDARNSRHRALYRKTSVVEIVHRIAEHALQINPDKVT
jgi:hypothetical protein